ncbi:hypothetical protein CERSUDRAFT_125019 [Gelatoporia subvermispora B]|uniref:F-box domain-containing protein n=1 Tax=Ceriporiopsis subvermispora (strain B) TaxID=914234 RepID=M2PGB8_CERS8|nr:hypothetical protein CERSUDRAFT_125019 [Gelatoporia subvermispora B]
MVRHRILPLELTDSIIDYLQEDVTSLKACSLACRAWLPACRFHKFRRMRVVEGRVIQFECMLRSSTHIGPCGRHLKIEFCTLEDVECFDSILQNLPKLRSLEVIFGPIYFKTPFRVTDVQSVILLTISCAPDFAKFNHVADFLGSFPNLEELHIHRLDFVTAHRPSYAELLEHEEIKKVDHNAGVIDHPMFLPSMGTLRTLQVRCGNREEIRTLPIIISTLKGCPLLKAIKVHIEDLHCDDYGQLISPLTSRINADELPDSHSYRILRDCPSVQSLHLSTTINRIQHYIMVLTSITQATIGELQLRFCCDEHFSFNSRADIRRLLLDFDFLARVLTRQSTRGIIFQRIRVMIECTCRDGAHIVPRRVKKKIADVFSLLTKRNTTLVFDGTELHA